jgi:dienelactone hydrolase
VDPARLAAIGYCFGGTGAIEARARSRSRLKAPTSPGDTPTPRDARTVEAKVLVLHGAEDPNVPEARLKAFAEIFRR